MLDSEKARAFVEDAKRLAEQTIENYDIARRLLTTATELLDELGKLEYLLKETAIVSQDSDTEAIWWYTPLRFRFSNWIRLGDHDEEVYLFNKGHYWRVQNWEKAPNSRLYQVTVEGTKEPFLCAPHTKLYSRKLI